LPRRGAAHGALKHNGRRKPTPGIKMTAPTKRPSPVLVLGPAHSGKSEFAHQLLLPDTAAVVIGTSAVKDRQTTLRIKSLNALRPPAWEILETSTDVAAAATAALARAPQVLIDSVNLWLASLVVEHGDKVENGTADDAGYAGTVEEQVLTQVDELCRLAATAKGQRLVIVSAELGGAPPPSRPAERLLRRLVGLANQRLARAARTVYTLQAGIPQLLKE
jgi:adenosylcobinamide kinase/adenosylcobinamide-phosphate guanylyltransferase